MCFEIGHREPSVKIKSGSEGGGHKQEYPIEEMAFLAAQLKREQESYSPMKRLVMFASQEFRLLSARLSFLEAETEESWYPAKYYYWMNQ